jgi:hypothetical protein
MQVLLLLQHNPLQTMLVLIIKLKSPAISCEVHVPLHKIIVVLFLFALCKNLLHPFSDRKGVFENVYFPRFVKVLSFLFEWRCELQFHIKLQVTF